MPEYLATSYDLETGEIIGNATGYRPEHEEKLRELEPGVGYIFGVHLDGRYNYVDENGVAQSKVGDPEVHAEELALTKREALQTLSGAIDYAAQVALSALGDVPKAEQLSWSIKADAARAHLAGTASQVQTDMLQSEADVTEESLDALANEIVTNAVLYEQQVARLSGLRRIASRAIKDQTGIVATGDVLKTYLAQVDPNEEEAPQ